MWPKTDVFLLFSIGDTFANSSTRKNVTDGAITAIQSSTASIGISESHSSNKIRFFGGTSTAKALETNFLKNATETANASQIFVNPPRQSNNSFLSICADPPPGLVGPIPVWMDEPGFNELSKLYPRVRTGGHNWPDKCTARHRVAIIVPYRDRETHLRIFLHNLHFLLTKQQLDYAIFVVEQTNNQTFNRGKLMNVGFVEASLLYDWQCFIFHDVDLFFSFVAITERQNCSECGRKRMYFCYDCKIYVGSVESMAPRVELPLRVDIVKHRHELNSKSTAIHALLISPTQTRMFDKFEEVPNYALEAPNSENVAVLFPSKNSLSIEQFVRENGPIRRIVVLDSTWNTVGQLKNIPNLAKLPWVHLRRHTTDYWRPQNGLSPDHLATIEAIYYACLECRETETNWGNKMKRERLGGGEGRDDETEEEPRGEDKNGRKKDDDDLDNLLFWFYFFRNMVPERKFLMKTYRTISYAGYKISRYPKIIARYKMIKHEQERMNPANDCRWDILGKTKQRWRHDGLSSLNYTVLTTTFHQLYTNIVVDLLERDSRSALAVEHISQKARKGC
uniref:tRNA-uridine aminocarboxypropyltransferase n=1 Tax=Globodera pallida TaxID=36090 RepID=A0A183BID0_GLOPA